MKIRNAGPDDLPAVVKVILAAINRERLWTNFVPKKGAQDAAYLHEIEKLLKEHLDPRNKDWVISVVDLADSASSPPRIAAVAVWDMSAADDDKGKFIFLPLLLLHFLSPDPYPSLLCCQFTCSPHHPPLSPRKRLAITNLFARVGRHMLGGVCRSGSGPRRELKKDEKKKTWQAPAFAPPE